MKAIFLAVFLFVMFPPAALAEEPELQPPLELTITIEDDRAIAELFNPGVKAQKYKDIFPLTTMGAVPPGAAILVRPFEPSPEAEAFLEGLTWWSRINLSSQAIILPQEDNGKLRASYPLLRPGGSVIGSWKLSDMTVTTLSEGLCDLNQTLILEVKVRLRIDMVDISGEFIEAESKWTKVPVSKLAACQKTSP